MHIRGDQFRGRGHRGRVGEAWYNDHRWLLFAHNTAICLNCFARLGCGRAATVCCRVLHLRAGSKRHEHRTNQ